MTLVQVVQLVLQGGTATALGLALAWIRDLQAQIRTFEAGRKDDSSKIAVLYERLMSEKAKNELLSESDELQS